MVGAVVEEIATGSGGFGFDSPLVNVATFLRNSVALALRRGGGSVTDLFLLLCADQEYFYWLYFILWMGTAALFADTLGHNRHN